MRQSKPPERLRRARVTQARCRRSRDRASGRGDDSRPGGNEMGLSSYEVRTSIAGADDVGAADFYEGKLGLMPGEEQADESRVYACGGGTSIHVYESPTGAERGSATVATWYVPDLDQVVDELLAKGVSFERY